MSDFFSDSFSGEGINGATYSEDLCLADEYSRKRSNKRRRTWVRFERTQGRERTFLLLLNDLYGETP